MLIPARVEINRQRKSIFTMIRFKVIAVPPNIFFSLEIMRKSGKKTEFRINRMVPEKYEEINTLWQIPFENSSLKFRIHTPTFFFFFFK